MKENTIRAIQGDTRSLDYGSYWGSCRRCVDFTKYRRAALRPDGRKVAWGLGFRV